MQVFNLFVYGTLKKECGGSILLKNAKFIEECLTIEKFKMVSNFSYPAVYFYPHGYCVLGELYQVSEYLLDVIDGYEGYPYFYKRKKIKVRGLRSNKIYEAYIYYIPEYLKHHFSIDIKPINDILIFKCRKN